MIKPNFETGIMSMVLKDNILEKVTVSINLKAFYNELHDALVNIGFKDMLGEKKNKDIGKFFGYQAKKGEFVDNKTNKNRTGDMFETQFYMMKKSFATELEIKWFAMYKSPFSKFGWYEYEFYLVVRNMKDIEIMENGKKNTLQNGSWEIKNKITYKNSIINDYLSTVPFIKNHHNLQHLYIDKIHGTILEKDILFGLQKIKPYIYKIFDKHFTRTM